MKLDPAEQSVVPSMDARVGTTTQNQMAAPPSSGPAAATTTVTAIPRVFEIPPPVKTEAPVAIQGPADSAREPAGLAYCRSRAKRCFDIGVSFVALVVLSPLLAFIALVIGLSSDGPVIYAQERCGMNGRRFRCWKFRSMRLGADSGPLMTHMGDRRITGVGRLLRMIKLDELPQLANVLTGDMSIVGPRPQAVRHVEMCGGSFVRVLAVRPGLTSPATIQFRHEEWLLQAVPDTQRDAFYRMLMDQKIRLNLEYIERASFAYDLRLIAQTLALLLRTRNRKAIAFLKSSSAGLPEV